MKIARDDNVASQREILAVDRQRDAALRKHLDYARSPGLAKLPPLERAQKLAMYVDEQFSPSEGRRFSEKACSILLDPYRNQEILLGEIVRAGVCRHRALLFKILGDEAGLAVALTRGNLGSAQSNGGHTWNELVLPDGEKRIVDVMNPRPGFRFPKLTDREAESYLTVDHRPYYRNVASTSGPSAKPTPSTARVSLADDPAGRELITAASRTIADYHRGQRRENNLLRIVYFHPSDRDPLPDYAERLERVMTDISDFYRDGLRRFGIENDGLPLERNDGRLVLHLVRGKNPASGYRHESGNETEAEIRAALKDTINFDREHVLVLYALCRKEPDGRYVFDAPYYGKGGSSQRWGFCHAADCELLDARLLTDTKNKIVYTEHYYPRVEQTLARFNAWYIGGIAHELGHGLGLNHDAGNPSENAFGTSLMGSGNHTYRQERWGGGKPTFLSRVSALQLVSHPLITGSNHTRWTIVGVGIPSAEFATAQHALQIRGKTGGNIPAYAVVAYVLPTSKETDHGNRTFIAAVENGTFDLSIPNLQPDNYHLRLVTLHVNGGTSTRQLRFGFDAAGNPDVSALNAAWQKLVPTASTPPAATTRSP
jgi:hypothetical protein